MLEFFWFSMFVQAQTTYLDHIYPFHHSYWGGKGADVFLLDGYMCIMEGMLADAKPHVLLEQPVQEIEMNSGKLQVFTEDHRIEADKVVITVPLHGNIFLSIFLNLYCILYVNNTPACF